jgi:hypothetical protein
MITYLDLCNRLIVELGINGGARLNSVSTNVISLEAIRTVNFVADADFEIQSLHHNWKFLWRQYKNTLRAGGDVLGLPVADSTSTPSVSYSSVSATGYYMNMMDRGSLVFNPDSTTLASRPIYQDWREFEALWQSRGTKTISNSPPYWSIDPAGNAIVSTLMADNTHYQYECWARPTRMRIDSDISPIVLATSAANQYGKNLIPPYALLEPSSTNSLTPTGQAQVVTPGPARLDTFSKESARIIIVRAKIIYAEVEGATEIMQGALAEYQDLLEELRASQLPGMRHDRVSETDIFMTVETE